MIIAYIYDRQGNLIDQFEDILDFSCEIKFNEVSSAQLDVANKNIATISNLIKPNNRISVYRQIGRNEKLLIEGYIRGYEADLMKTSIKIEDKLSMFEDWIIYNNISFTGSVKNLLTNILNERNGRENTGITLDCNVEDVITKSFNKGEIVSNIIKDIRQNKYEYKVSGDKLIFKESIGTDLSVVEGSLVLNWDRLDPSSRTIRSARIIGDMKQVANCTIGKDNTGFIQQYEDAESIAEYGRIERPFTNNGSITESVQGFIDEKKNNFKEYEIDPIVNDFRACDVGDTISVYINSGNDLMYYNGTMKVLEKRFVAGTVDRVSFRVGEGKMKNNNLIEEIKEIKQRTARLEYNQ